MAEEEVARIVVTPLTQREADRRAGLERLIARFPSLYPRIAVIGLRLPRRSALRRRSIAYAIKRAYAAGNRRDFEVLLAGIDPDHEFRPCPEIMPPDLGEARGHAGYMRMWNHWLDAFGDLRFEPEEILDFGDKLLVTVRQTGHGSGSGVGLSLPVYQLLTIRHGRTVLQEDFVDRDEALRAAAS